jgi:hypothetical protein
MAYSVSIDDFFLDFELSFAQGDSSIYDTETLRKNEAFNQYGFGSIIRLYALPDVFNSGNVKPTVDSTEVLSSLAISYNYNKGLTSASCYIVKDQNLWVVLPSVITTDKKVAKKISQEDAVKKYKRDSKHLGKFNNEQNAKKYKTYVDSYFDASLKARAGSSETRAFGPYITSFEVSYSIEAANQIQFTVIDKDYEMMEKNFFMNRRQIMYRGEMYEIGVVEVGQGPAGSPQVTVTAWNAAVQKMKRDKKPENLSGSSAYEYAFNAAKKYGLNFIAQKNGKTQTINKGSGNNKDESVWSVLQSAANADEFVLYVMDGTMVYGSQKWLMWKFGTDSKAMKTTQLASAKGLVVKGNIDLSNRPIVKNNDGSISTVRSISITEGRLVVVIPTVIKQQNGSGAIVSDSEAIRHYKKTGQHLGKFSSTKDADAYSVALSAQQEKYYVSNVQNLPVKKYSRLYFDPGKTLPNDAQKFQVAQYPTVRQSENDPLEGDGSIQVFKPNGCIIRPGYTVIIGPKPSLFQGGYLVTEVSFSEGTNEPVQISFRTPEKPATQTDTP